MESIKGQLKQRGFEEEAKVWTGSEMVQMLGEEPLFITATTLSLYKVCYLPEITHIKSPHFICEWYMATSFKPTANL